MKIKHLKILLIIAGSFSLLLGVALAITVYGIVFGALLIFGGIRMLSLTEVYVAKHVTTMLAYKKELTVWCILFFVGLNAISSALLLYVVLYLHSANKKILLNDVKKVNESNAEGLHKLTTLHSEGLISEEDFNEMKEKLTQPDVQKNKV